MSLRPSQGTQNRVSGLQPRFLQIRSVVFIILRSCPFILGSQGPTCPRKHVRKVACQLYLTGFCPLGLECLRGQYVYLFFLLAQSIHSLLAPSPASHHQAPMNLLPLLPHVTWGRLPQASLDMPTLTKLQA